MTAHLAPVVDVSEYGSPVVSSCRPLLAALVILAASAANAQTVLAGRVVDRAKRVALEKVGVELLSVTDSVFTTGETGADGTFALMAPRGGTYRVRLTPPSADVHVSDTLVVPEGEYVAREFIIDVVPKAYLEFQVNKPVQPARGSPQPRYPNDKRQAGIAGCVTVSFVVDTTGRAERSTLKLLRYSDRAFVESVWEALPKMQFIPAELGGRKVRQLVHQPFTFSITGGEQLECTSPPRKP